MVITTGSPSPQSLSHRIPSSLIQSARGRASINTGQELYRNDGASFLSNRIPELMLFNVQIGIGQSGSRRRRVT